jgi:hypothetical protein
MEEIFITITLGEVKAAVRLQKFWPIRYRINEIYVDSNLVQYLLQTDIQKRIEKIQWKIQTLHIDFSPGNPNRENQHILY